MVELNFSVELISQMLIKAVFTFQDGDMTEADRKKAQMERQRRVALRSSVIQELRQQYSDAPEEIRDRRDFQSEREGREELHRKNYEESMMVRLNVPKHERKARKRSTMAMSGQLSGITHFSDITALTGGEGGQVCSHSKPLHWLLLFHC